MAMLVPRISVRDETAAVLRARAEGLGVSIGDVIAGMIEGNALGSAVGERETLYRILKAGEKAGLKVGGANEFPRDWEHHGGLTRDVCRKLAADYKAWRQRNDDVAGGCEATEGGP